jgi:hypothetical protein
MTDTITDGGKVHADAWSTERAAADEQTTERKRATYEQIVECFRDAEVGLTDDELRAAMHALTGHPQSKSGPATRRGELVELSYVRPRRYPLGAVVKRPSDGGRPMIVWELVPADEYVRPEPSTGEREPSARGLAVAKRYADWETGDSSLAGALIRAYLNPEAVAAELDDMGAL